MNRPKHLWPILAACLCVLTSLFLGFLWGKSNRKGTEAVEPEAKEGVVAMVKTAAIQKGKLEGRLAVFGSIVAAPGSAQTISVPYECRVSSIAVREGQFVPAGFPLATVADSPDALLALEQARIDAISTNAQLQQAKSRHSLKLADNAQLAQAQQAFDSAQTRLKSLESRQMGTAHSLRSVASGVVVKVAAQVGAVLPAATSILEVVDPSRLEARLGIEPQDALRACVGGSVEVIVVDGVNAAKAKATLRGISPVINPATRLRDGYVTLPAGHPFLFGQYVRGNLLAAAREGFIVPYASVLPEDGKHVLYTVRKGLAVRHEVQILSQDGDRIQIVGQDLDPSEPVVIQGNYELQDGMAVRVEEPSR